MNQGPGEVPQPNPFLDLIHDVGPHALRFATYWTGQPAVAEDIVQEAVAEAWAHRDRLPCMKNPRAWFLAIVRRGCIDHHRRQKRHPATVDINDLQHVLAGRWIPLLGSIIGLTLPTCRPIYRHGTRRFWPGDTGWTGHSIPSLNTRDFRCRP
ncbi:MAG: RNA polymerase sigma factor [Firmicutes bacterium]|nr:RNA polymerase sigma factor [Bacillota bacterium]